MNAAGNTPGRAILKPPFVVCAVVLAAAAVFAGPVAKRMKVVLRKEPVPLRKPLSQLDKLALGEFEFDSPTILDPAVLGPLGTEEYISWLFQDTSIKESRHPLRYVSCFVTYYTGRPDLVPHIPQVCYLGQGYTAVTEGQIDASVLDPNGVPLEVPLQAVTFQKSDVFNRAKPTVAYTFHCNGRFLGSRTDVRTRLANPFDRGAYFCKIEVSFGTPRSSPPNPTRQEAIAAAEKFFNRLLPVLLRDHLPDWEAVQKGEPAV